MDAIIGLAVVVLLGYLAAHHFRTVLRRWEGLDQFLISGFLFIFLGVLFGPQFLNVLTPAVIRQLDPFIYLGLGWIGFIVGIQFEWRLLRHVPKRLFILAQLESVVSTAVLSIGLLAFFGIVSLVMKIPAFDAWTGAIILAVCGATSSSLTIHYHNRMLPKADHTLRTLEYLVSLHVFLPLLGLAFLFSFFHVDQVEGAHLSGWVWLGIHHLAGFFLGILMFYLLRARLSETERQLLILGGIAFASGIAAYLHISPIVVCFIAGIVFANMPGFNNVLMQAVLRRAERPIYLILLILAGSLWNFRSAYGWVFLVVYVVIRFAAKYLALLSISKVEPTLGLRFSHLGSLLAQGPLAIALVVGYEQRYASPFLPAVVTAILAGAIVNEILAGKMLRKAFPVSPPEQPEP